MPETENKLISKEKLISYLKSCKIDTTGIDNSNRYLYSTGRNSMADILLIGIYCGDFDEQS
jgi:hypothetical protein